ncbi:hypothetical protein N9164_03795 [Draconibacterium sp.]|nr:hypothetical protein [Draconibacterium sp.]
MGQKLPGRLPELFAPGIISTDFFEFAITFSKDGRDIFFTRRSTNQGGGNSIFHTYFNDSVWTNPTIASFAKAGYVEMAPYCSPDQQKIYFHSEREHPETGVKMTNDEKIWYSIKNGNVWGEANFLKGILNTGWVMGVAAANSGNLYLCGEVDGSEGLLYSECIDGKYPSAKKCFDGVHPYVSPTEEYIIYDVILENWEETELYIRFKKQDGDWGKAIRLPSVINATKTESFGRVSPDGKYLFFQRNGDIYWVDFKQIIRDIT